jgi:hypothetical protein
MFPLKTTRCDLSPQDITYPVRLYGEVVHSTDAKGNWCVKLGGNGAFFLGKTGMGMEDYG